jgi:hypothetical protein
MLTGRMTKLTNEPEEKGEGKKQTPLRAIRAKCLDCVLGSSNEVALCTMENKCSLWPYRFGKNPNVKLSDEERERRRQMARENLAFTKQIEAATIVEAGDGN